jgi:hypothetical protein
MSGTPLATLLARVVTSLKVASGLVLLGAVSCGLLIRLFDRVDEREEA